jgi:hypothetical protein
MPLGELCAGADAIALVEGWRGPLWHWVTADGPTSLARVKVVDPSFRNWPALEYAVLNNIVPDFPPVTNRSISRTPGRICKHRRRRDIARQDYINSGAREGRGALPAALATRGGRDNLP